MKYKIALIYSNDGTFWYTSQNLECITCGKETAHFTVTEPNGVGWHVSCFISEYKDTHISDYIPALKKWLEAHPDIALEDENV